MPAYDESAQALNETLGPVADYCQRAHDQHDASDPALAGKFKHVTKLEALIDAVVDFGAAAQQERLPPSPRIAALSERIRNSAAYQNATMRPEHLRPLAGQITSHCLPLPAHARTVRPIQEGQA